MGWLRRILGGGGAEDDDEDQDAEEPRAAGVSAPPGDEDLDPAERIDAARERLREEIPPLQDEE